MYVYTMTLFKLYTKGHLGHPLTARAMDVVTLFSKYTVGHLAVGHMSEDKAWSPPIF